MSLVKGMRGTVRNVKARTKAVSSATVVGLRKDLPTRPTNRRPFIMPHSLLEAETSNAAPGRSEAERPVVIHLYAWSKLVMAQPARRVNASTDSIANHFLGRSKHVTYR